MFRQIRRFCVVGSVDQRWRDEGTRTKVVLPHCFMDFHFVSPCWIRFICFGFGGGHWCVLFLESREASAGYGGGGLEAADPTRGSSCTAPRASSFFLFWFFAVQLFISGGAHLCHVSGFRPGIIQRGMWTGNAYYVRLTAPHTDFWGVSLFSPLFCRRLWKTELIFTSVGSDCSCSSSLFSLWISGTSTTYKCSSASVCFSSLAAAAFGRLAAHAGNQLG